MTDPTSPPDRRDGGALRYHRAATLADAVERAARGGRVLAGGTDLVGAWSDGLVPMSEVVDISRLPLDRITVDGPSLRIGATARLAEVAAHTDVRRECPALAGAIDQAASVAIRHQGTLAGNLLQTTRCPYFRLPGGVACHLRRPGSGCAAGEGDRRATALVRSGVCQAVHPSDPAVALLHAGATIVIATPQGERVIPLEALYRSGPGVGAGVVGGVITEIVVPISVAARAARFGKVRDRASFDFALVSAAVSADPVRIVLGGVAWGPYRCPVAEERLAQGAIDASAVHAALTAELIAVEDRTTLVRAGRERYPTDEPGPPAEGGRFKIELAARVVVDLLRGDPAPASRPPIALPALGSPPRQDAVAKVTGAARYLADLPAADCLEGVFVLAPIPAGRLRRVDRAAALAIPGVVRVVVPGELPAIAPLDHWAAGQSRVPLMDDLIVHEGQPIGLVLATSRLAAERGAELVTVECDRDEARTDFAALEGEAVAIDDWAPSDTSVGSIERGLAEAAATVEAEYATADRHHAALEPAAVIARFAGETLTVDTTTQWVAGVKTALAAALGIPAERIRVRAPSVGGGFGAKGSTWGHEILAALLAREMGRPIRIVLPRGHTFTLHGYQPATRHRVLVAARADGTLTAIRHRSRSAAAMLEDYIEHGSMGSRTLSACPNILTEDRIVRLHRPQPTFMRAPHEGPGIPALEIAMDELAVKLGIDPVELRLRNDPSVDPTTGLPFSSKELARCLTTGAEMFGWARRTREPGSMRDGSVRIGWGMASALMATFRFGATARVTVRRDGSVLVESAAHEIGTGVGTTLAIVAGEALGVDPGRIEVRLGDTELPEAGGTFGSATTLSVGSAVLTAARRLRARLEELAGEPGLAAREYPDLLALRRLDHVAETGQWAPVRENVALNAYGAVFVEVRVDPGRPVPRVVRALGVYSIGRVVNPTGARSQAIGGIVWGIGQALLEDSRFDPVTGRFLARGYGSYHVPVNADIGPVEAHFVAEHDPIASPLGSRGVGEIGTIGVGAAVANAVHHATGVRVRTLPIRVETLLREAP